MSSQNKGPLDPYSRVRAALCGDPTPRDMSVQDRVLYALSVGWGMSLLAVPISGRFPVAIPKLKLLASPRPLAPLQLSTLNRGELFGPSSADNINHNICSNPFRAHPSIHTHIMREKSALRCGQFGPRHLISQGARQRDCEVLPIRCTTIGRCSRTSHIF